METVFSGDDIPDSFWVSTGGSGMNRSSSEWFLQTFLHEASAVTESPVTDATASSAVPSITTKSSSGPELIDSDVERKGKASLLSDPPPPVLNDTEEYQAFSKRPRNLTCSAVVSSRVSFCFYDFSLSLIQMFYWMFSSRYLLYFTLIGSVLCSL